jgi:hypothetical protein
MPEAKQSTPNIGGSGYALLILAAAGTFFVTHRTPLEGSRPPTTETFIHERVGVQDIESRLWQDPFAAAAERLRRTPDLKPDNCDKAEFDIEHHCKSPLEHVDVQKPLPLVLVASVSGAPYSEDHEVRRRTRYAIVAGLRAEDFVPDDPQHIGFYWPRAASSPRVKLPEVIPFEWFTSKSGRRALLLWFDESVLGPSPLKQFGELFCRSLFNAETRLPLPWSKANILGPESSAVLKAMAHEDKDDWANAPCPNKTRPQFYVYSATADDTTLIPKELLPSQRCNDSDDCLHNFFLQHKSVDLHRLTVADDALARTIRDELRLRRPPTIADELANWLPLAIRTKLDGWGIINKPAHIVLISEWDSLYGRSLPDTMARCLGDGEGNNCNEIKPHYLHRYSYLRGLDGQMPNVDGFNAGNKQDTGSIQDKNGKDTKEAKDSIKVLTDARPSERAEGQGQFDYLQRLGDEIEELDNQEGIQAVGILGSDRYDKLLVLQALRPLLPNALFFTSDLDALVLQPTALAYTRNLLIASSFGLQLAPASQTEIPPFRSSYQTAGFLATRNAINSVDDPPRPAPLIFEVGSSRAFQFPVKCESGRPGCASIHPVSSAMFPRVSLGVAGVLAVAFTVLALGVALSCGPLKRPVLVGVDVFLRGSKSGVLLYSRAAMIFIGLCLFMFALFGIIYALSPKIADWLTEGGQPIIWLEGISVWPTIFLRAAIFATCVVLFVHAYWWLNKNMEKVARDLDLVETWQSVESEQYTVARACQPWIRVASRFFYRMQSDEEVVQDSVVPHDISRFWRVYIYQGFLTARIYRVAAGVATMFLFWLVLHLVFVIPPAPARGSVTFWTFTVVTSLLVFATVVLVFFVADTTLLCWRIIEALRKETSVWPAKTLQKFSERLGLPQTDLDDWIDLVFISKRTKCITTLIYFPFLIIALMVVSRSRLFANYGVNIPDLVAMALGLLIVIACAVALRRAAEASRAKARRRLNDQIMLARKSDGEAQRAVQLEMLLRRVEELHDGALTPFSQQPVVRAMLLPLGTFGGTALVEYLFVPGLW